MNNQVKLAKAKSILSNPAGVAGISFVKNDEVAELPKLIERLEALIEEGNRVAGDNSQALADIDIKDYEAELTNLANDIMATRRAIEAVKIPDNSEMVARLKKLDDAIGKIKLPDWADIKLPAPVVNVKANDDDIYSRYSFSDKSTEVDGDYIGYLNSFGNWFIQRIAQPNDKTYRSRFSAGKNDYSANWNKRVKLTYELRHKVDII